MGHVRQIASGIPDGVELRVDDLTHRPTLRVHRQADGVNQPGLVISHQGQHRVAPGLPTILLQRRGV